jgi:hypothetical protein
MAVGIYYRDSRESQFGEVFCGDGVVASGSAAVLGKMPALHLLVIMLA